MTDLIPRARKAPIPVTILTGFLGAGKTSLLNQLVGDPLMKDAAIIINEFGDIGLDHLLVAGGDDGIVELSSGCLCCTIRGELVTALEDFLRAIDNHRIAALSRIVIETTGLADPAPVLHTIMAHPYLSMRYVLDGVITVVDAVNGAATLDAHKESVRQAAVADRVVISKADLPEGQARLPGLIARLQALNPSATVLRKDLGQATTERLLNAGLYNADQRIPDVKAWLRAEAFDNHHHHDHHHGHSCGPECDHDHHHDHNHAHHHHDVNRHDESIRTFTLATDQAIPAGSLAMFLDLLRSAHGPQLLRVKGVVKVLETPDRPVVIHGVQEIFHPPSFLPAWPDADHRTRFVFITDGLEENFVRRLFDAFAGHLAPDQPDRAAMADNPLSLGGFSTAYLDA